MEAAVLDIDYINLGDNSTIRMTVKSADGSVHELLDTELQALLLLRPDGQERRDRACSSRTGRR